MSAFILDCSVAMGWCFKDEATPASDALLDRLAHETAAVPSLWHLELANVLALSQRKGRITAARAAEFIALLSTLAITVDESTPFRALGAILNLAVSENLTAYDAAYLELAMRLGVPLATKDHELRKAGKRLGVAVLGV